LLLIHVILLPAVGPGGFSLDARTGAFSDGAGAFGAEHIVGILVVAADNLAVGHKGADTVGVEVVDFEVIEDVAAFGRDGTSAYADATHGSLVVHRPGNL